MHESEPAMMWEEACEILAKIGIKVIENDDTGVARAKKFIRSLGKGWGDKPSFGVHDGRALWLLGGVIYVEKIKPENKDHA